jgi:cytoskeletal protein CcmA (bactofilin family)
MASTFTTLGIEKMATGENAGTWGDKTNTNLDIVNTALSGYVEQSIAGGADTTPLSITDGAATSVAQNAVIKLTGSITGNQIVTVPDSVEKVYIITNGTSGAFTVQFKTASGSGVTFGVSEKTTKLLYSDGTNIVDAGFSGAGDLDGNELVLDADGDTSITADTDDQIDIKIAGTDQLTIKDGALSPVTDNDIDLGTSTLEFKDAFFDGTVTSDAFAGPLTGNVTGNVSGTAATVTTAAQSNITSLGTLTTLTVDNIITNGSNIGHTSDTDLITLADGVVTVAGELDATTLDISGNADIDGTLEADAITINGTAIASVLSPVAGGSGIVTTGALNSGSITSGFGTIDTGSSTITTTGLISGGSLDIDNVLINGTTIGHTDDTDLITLADGVVTVAGELDATTLDISGDADIDGTLEADAITINGTAIASVLSPIAGGSGIVTTGALDTGSITSGFGAIDNGTSGIRTNTFTAETSFVPDAQDGAALGTTSLQFSDLFLADGAVIGMGDDNEVTITHVADTGVLLNGTNVIQLRDSAINIGSPADGDLDINADDEIELNSTLIDINGNVEISGTATTTGVHTFTAVPVFPNNTIETADIQDNAITLAKLAGGTDGNIISFDASGDPVAIATGSDGQVLTSTGAGSPPAFEDAAAAGISAGKSIAFAIVFG